MGELVLSSPMVDPSTAAGVPARFKTEAPNASSGAIGLNQ